MSNDQNKKNDVLTIGPGRFSYMHVFKPRKNKRGEEKYETCFLIPKKPHKFNSDPEATYQTLKDRMVEIAKATFGDNLRGVKMVLKDGDATSDEYPDPKFPGHWYLSATAKTEWPPVLVDGDRQPAKEGAWVSGDWGFINVKVFAYKNDEGKGVSLGLRAIQFLYKDEPFAKGLDVDSTFDVVPGSHKPEPVVTAAVEEDAFDPFA